MRINTNVRRRRVISFFLTAVLLFGIWPVNTVMANGVDAEEGSPPVVVLEANEPDAAAEGEVPVEGEAPAEGEFPTPAEEEVHTPAEGEAPTDGNPAEMEGPPVLPTDVVYENSISGFLWLDTYEDIENGIIGGDGIRQAEEEALSGYAVSLFLTEDRGTAVQTDTTDGSGEYRFENMEPGSYVVGIFGTTSGGVEYLLPIAGDTGDNQFSDFSANHTTIYSASIEVEEDTSVSGINAGMRMPQGNAIYENSINGSLWLDTYEDAGSGIVVGDGIRQAEEGPLSGFSVRLYFADDRGNAVQTVATDGNGHYRFENMEPGTYVVGISAATVGGVEYLMPIAGVTGDNRFGNFSEDYDVVYSSPIEISEDTVVTGIDAGMRTKADAVKTPHGAVTGAAGNWLYRAGVFQFRIDAYNRTTNGISLTMYYQYGQNHYSVIAQLATDPGFTNVVSSKSFPGSPASGGTSNLSFSGLSSTQTYYLRFYAYHFSSDINPSFNTQTQYDQYFVFAPPPPPPTITSLDVYDLSSTDVRIKGSYTSETPVDAHSIWITPAGGATTHIIASAVGLALNFFGAGTFATSTLAEMGYPLQPNTTYSVRYHLHNNSSINLGHGPGWSDAVGYTFTTLPLPPTANTTAATNIGTTTAQLNGTYNLQGAAVNSGVFRYSTDPGLAGYTEVGFGPGYTSTNAWNAISGLSPNTTYYYQIYVTNGNAGGIGGSDSGGIASFTTLPNPPTIDSFYPAWIAKDNAQLQGTYSSATSITGYNLYLSDDGGASWLGPTDIVVNDAFGTGTFLARDFDTYYIHYGWKLHPNSAYLVHIYAWNAGGCSLQPGIYNIITLPDFTSWNVTPDSGDATKATVSGTYAGDQPITGATVTYGLQSDLSDGNTITLSQGTDFTDSGFSYELTGLTGGTWYVQTTVTNVTGTTPSEIRPFTVGYTVTVKYLDKAGAPLAAEHSESVSGGSYPLPLAPVNAHQAAYYTVNTGSRQDIDLTVPAPSLTITADTSIEVYYASTVMTISYPVSGMNFAALHTNGGAITSGSYEFKNQSDLPVRVSFKEMSVTNGDGLNFVQNASSNGEIHLNLVPVTGANSNGFTGISNIAPGSYTSLLGTLDGDMVGNAGTSWGYLSIGGHYEGPFTLTPKRPELEFTFNFVLVQ